MKIQYVAIILLCFLFSSCEKSDDELLIGPDLQNALLQIQQDRDLTDEEMLNFLQEWVSVEQVAMREDLWGAGGFEAFSTKVARDMKEQMQRFETMSLLSEVSILEYLQRDDVDGAREHLRSNIAYRYREELQKGTPQDDSMMVRVKTLAAEDPELERLMIKRSSGEQGSAGQPEKRSESIDSSN